MPDQPSPLPPPTPLPPALTAAIRAGTVKTIVLAGGTFDPPHRAHLAMAGGARHWPEHVGRAPSSSWLLLIPAARSPFKADGPIASDADRVQMLRLAAADSERAEVWTDEIDRAAISPGSPSYTIETAERLRQLVDEAGGKGIGLRLVIGADQALQFHKWREFERLLSLAEPLVLPRGDIRTTDDLGRALRNAYRWTEVEVAAWLKRLLPFPTMDDSSTRVRAGLAHAATPNEQAAARLLVLPSVMEYIDERRLYR